MMKILEQTDSPPQVEFDKFFAQFLVRGEISGAHVGYRTRCVAECCGDVFTVDHNGRTLLHWAIIDGNFEAVQFLVSNGAEVNVKCSLGNTPLHWITCLWFDNGDYFARFLVSQGADVNATNNRGLTPLHFAAFYGKVHSAKFLISAGAAVNINNNPYKYTPLHLAVRDAETARFLISVGADIHAKNNWGYTPLHEAAWTGTLETVKILIAAGADIDVKDEFSETPLDVAVRNGHTEVAEYLSDFGLGCVPFRNSKSRNLTAAHF